MAQIVFEKNIEELLAKALMKAERGLHAWFNKEDWPGLEDGKGSIEIDSKPLTSVEEYIFLLSLLPSILPGSYERLIEKYLPAGGNFPEFGGVRPGNYRGFIPTGETVLFILAGANISNRITVQSLFDEEHLFFQKNILWVQPVPEGEPKMSGKIIMAQEWIDLIIYGKESTPRFGIDFPAKKIDTRMLWDDLVLHPQSLRQLKDIGLWMQYHHQFDKDYNLKNKAKPGYRALFHGPPGTGKTMAAGLLGKELTKEVYKIDLSQVVSKYIGETEKNLENVFRKASSKNWILFFDEADALFGKRTGVSSAHDKYANQEVSYLLQRVEDYPGLIILASNYKNNMDSAFVRRFQSIIHFPMPGTDERLLIWKKAMPASLKLQSDINLNELATQYEMSGASVLNAVLYASLNAFERNDGCLTHKDLLDGIRKEYLKEEKSM